MTRVEPLTGLGPDDDAWAGSKAVRLGQLARAGFAVPAGLVIDAAAYQRFVEQTGLRRAIQLLLRRKRFEDMRWEEIWDLALRVRNLFGRTDLTGALRARLESGLAGLPSAGPLAVRSAALGEDSAGASFAGLHESFINVSGVEQVLEKVRLVWASLWSDRALLYRQELGLDPRRSSIAVLVQELVVGRASGVAFSRGPADEDELLIEGVWGLNQALVDGTVPPHRWHLERESGRLRRATPAEQTHELRLDGAATSLLPLEPPRAGQPPLGEHELQQLFAVVREVERLFGAPQDVEWTLTDAGLVLLQARPITAAAAGDQRRFYLGLHRSLDSLRQLRRTIEQRVLPEMDREAAALADVDLAALDGAALAAEIERRRAVRQRWVDEYWEHCIPFAHGTRLFGQVYNDRCKPEDPFEFVQLLEHDQLLGTQRNAELQQLARELDRLPAAGPEEQRFERQLEDLLQRYGLSTAARDRQALLQLLARLPRDAAPPARDPALEARFLERFAGEERRAMAELLELARASYRLRDDDNIYLGRVEAQLVRAVREAARRVGQEPAAPDEQGSTAELLRILEDPELAPLAGEAPERSPALAGNFALRARQLVGQPASAGLAVGRARVILERDQLLSFRQGEVLVCDAIDPNMTFVAPLAAAVVERRGGMLIHGAIIAREYGIPCVTGVPDATRWIHTGDTLTVDGHVGLVTVSAPRSDD